MSTIMPGMKYEALDENENTVFYRILRANDDNSNTYKAIIEGDPSYEKHDVSYDFLLNNCVRIVPDAFINIMCCTIDDNGTKDVYICVNKTNDINANNDVPSMIIRQNIYSYTKNATISTNMYELYMGDCFTIYNNEDLKSLMEIKTIDVTYSIAFYLGDSQILVSRFIDNNTKKEITKTLLDIENHVNKQAMFTFKGFSESIDSLMSDNNFIVGIYGIFNIMYIDFNIDTKTNHNEEDDIILTNEQITRIQSYIGKFISNPLVVKYDKDIDVANIVTKQHIMVVDPTMTIYLIAFDVIEERYNTGEDEDILRAMGVR